MSRQPGEGDGDGRRVMNAGCDILFFLVCDKNEQTEEFLPGKTLRRRLMRGDLFASQLVV